MAIFNLGAGGGGSPTLEARTVTPSTEQQIITPSRDEYDGLSQVTVEATPLETRTVNPSTSSQILTPSGSNIGFSTITVNPYRLQSKSVTPSTSAQTVKPDTGKDGLSQVTVNAMKLQSKSVTLSSNYQIITPDSIYDGFNQVIASLPSTTNKYSLGGASDPFANYTCSFTDVGDFAVEVSISFTNDLLDNVFFLLLQGVVLHGSSQIQERFTLAYLPFANSHYWRTENTGVIEGVYGSLTNNTITFSISRVTNDGVYAMGSLNAMKMVWGN